LQRGVFDHEGMLPRGGGAYFSFTSKTNDYDSEPHIELQNGNFSSGFYGGNFGVVELVDGVSIENISLVDLPEAFVSASTNEFESYERNRNRNRRRPHVAQAGDLFVVRSVEWGKYDIVAVFQVVDKDKYGATIVWKKLKTFPVPPR